ncbi:MAG: uracil-DNA glycosylase [Ktedonobacterales bacterium]|nr:uracil-DNA glycosylase [Ktedonobacterales bacterium]
MTTPEPEDSLEKVAAEVRVCQKCPLARTRIKAVPGDGPGDAEALFIGEGPGMQEDRVGRPFVGPAGQFLDEMLGSVQMQRSGVFVTNVVKCRPPENRDPSPDEIAACAPYLTRQLALINPKVVVTLGKHSMSRFFSGEQISKIHGRLRNIAGQPVLPLYHPAAALHRAELRQTELNDFQQVPLALAAARTHTGLPPAEATKTDDPPPEQLSLFG